MKNARAVLLLLLAASLIIGCPKGDDDDVLGDWVLGEVIDNEGPGVLASMDGPWGDKLYILRVEGNDYEMGYQYGRLQGQMMLDLYWTYIGDIGEEMGAGSPEEADVLVGNLLDGVWEQFAPHNSPEWNTRLEGVAAGMEDAGCFYDSPDADLQTFVYRLVSFAELAVSSSLDGDDLLGLAHFIDNGVSDELGDWYGRGDGSTDGNGRLDDDGLADEMELLRDPRWESGAEAPTLNCSVYAGWGEHTEGGRQFTVRNMDYSSGTGIYQWANVAAFVPDDGIPYISFGWAGLTLGAGLAGVNQKGVYVGNAMASSPMERINVESAVIKGARMLQTAEDLDTALEMFSGDAITMGANAMISWGDPDGGGANAETAALEINGASIAVFRTRHDCSNEVYLNRYDYDGKLESSWTDQDHPEWVNFEADAREIDGEGNVRYFECTDPCETMEDLVLDNDGKPFDAVKGGMPIQLGYPLDCAVYRGDSALAYGVRIHQYASHGPMDEGSDGLMHRAGAYKERYKPYHDMTQAYRAGESYTAWEEEVIPPTGSEQLVGLDQVEAMSRVASMRSSGVWAYVLDTTDLKMRMNYESGMGDDWLGCYANGPYMEIDLNDLFLTD